MSTKRRRLVVAIGFLGLLAAVGGALASGGSAASVAAQSSVVRLTATLTPTTGTSTASGRWEGLLVSRGARPGRGTITVHCFTPPKGVTPKPQARLKCGAVIGGTKGTPAYSVVAWRLTFQKLSSPVTGADIRIAASPGAAPTVAANLCSTCVAGKTQATKLTTDQAGALLAGRGSVVVRTVNAPAGELSGSIVKGASLSARS